MIKEKIKKLAKQYFKDTVEMRRHLHQNPELSYEEEKTGKYIVKKLNEFKVANEHGCAVNGVVGLIKGKNPEKRVLALRADMDALPIQEANDVPYKSKKKE